MHAVTRMTRGAAGGTGHCLARRSFAVSHLVGTDSFRWQKKGPLARARAEEYANPAKPTIKVAVTGASGNIAYSLLFRLAAGEMFGKDQRVQIHLYDLPMMMDKVKGVAMEIQDCAFPTCNGVLSTDDLGRAFEDIDVALMVGSKPRGPGQERGDLIRENGGIFKVAGEALNKHARPSVKVTVVGNPANTNCLILANNAPDIPIENFSAMTRLDHDRGLGQLAAKAKCTLQDIQQFCIWGNHSPTMFPDLSHCTIRGQPAMDALKGANPGEDIQAWYEKEFLPTVQQRGAAIIEARGLSSAASAANACLNAARDWELGTGDAWTSMAIASNGEYGVEQGLFFSYPVRTRDQGFEIVKDLPQFSDFAQQKVKATEKELKGERDIVAQLLPN